MDESVEPGRPHSPLTEHRSAGCWLFLFSALVLLPPACLGAVKRPPAVHAAVSADAPSGFLPGLINYFAGNGNGYVQFSNGSVPTQVSVSGITATDSHGNVYIGSAAGALYMVYAGNSIPAALANVTTNATPAMTPEAGRIYQVGGFAQVSCGACEGMPLDQVSIANIVGLVIDTQDNLYYSDANINVVRRVDPATSNVTTIAGQWNVASYSGDGGPGSSATLNLPEDIKLDSFGNLYIDDNFNDLVRVVYLGTQPPPLLAAEGTNVSPGQKGYIFSVAGVPYNYCTTAGQCGDGASATSAGLGYELSIAVDAAGNLYIADAMVNSSGAAQPYIRVVYAGGTVPTILNQYLNPNGGNSTIPQAGYIYPATGYNANPQFAGCFAAPCGDGGLAGNVVFGFTPNGGAALYITTDALGNLYIADEYDFAVRKIDTSGYASTIAGIDNPSQTPPATIPVPPGGTAAGTFLDAPYAISFDAQNNLYISDSDLIWIVAPLLAQTINFPDFDPATVSYGVEPITLAASASSSLPVQYAVAAAPNGIAHLNSSQLVVTGAGNITVTASQAGNDSYAAAAPVVRTLTVEQAPLTVTANATSKVLGAANPTFTATITGFVNGDTATTPGVFSGAPAFSTTATTTSPIGTYPIIPSIGTLVSTNYSFPAPNFIDGTLTITGNLAQTINFPALSPATVAYGQAPITLSATASSGGLVTFVLVSGPGVLSGKNGSTLTITGAGAIVIEATQEGYQQYAAAPPVTRTLNVNPAQLTVTGPTVTTTYGTTIDSSTFPPSTITGFVGTDTQSSVLTGAAQYTTVTGTPNAGTYPITVSLGTITLLPAAAANYTFAAPVNGSLIVQPAAQTIQFNPIPYSQIYGNILQLAATATSGLPVTFKENGPAVSYNGINSQLELNGTGTVIITATQAGNGNYLPATPTSQTLNVGPAPLTIGLAQAYSREEGAPNPVFQFTIQGFVLADTDIPSVITGTPLLTTSATQSSPPGVYPIIPSQGTLAAPNYYFVYVDGTLTVTPPGSFTISASPGSLTIPSGLSGQATLTLTPNNFYQGMVTLSCGQVPANVTCVISPTTYVFPGNQAPPGVAPIEYSAQGTITISASGAPIAGALWQDDSIQQAAIWLIPGGLAGLLLAMARRRAARRTGVWGVLVILALGAGMITAASCGGSSHLLTAAPGTTQLMITGSGTSISGGAPVTASLPLTITVQ
jgi:hypothetical protein